uniref:Uncharacterized protein LOC109504942 n=1 Tax=Elaeis guineensis var. tenera TaxID=51953 RepID=A0A6J0PAK8_ELAGV|nr:uncharacterized protein LOC109504942 [Elaeis guineensis]
MLHELKLLSKVLDHPSSGDMKSMPTIEEVCAKLQELRPRLQPFMDLLFPLKEQGKQEDQQSAQKFPEEIVSIDRRGTDSAVVETTADSGNLHLAETMNKKSRKKIKSKPPKQTTGERKGEAGSGNHKGKDTRKSEKRRKRK